GGEDAEEVQGVGSRDGEQGAVLGLAAELAQLADGLGEGELLAGEAFDEAAAADLAAGFETTEDHHQVAPGEAQAFALEELAEDHAVAGEQRARGALDGLAGGRGGRSAAAEGRPAA